MKKSSYSVKRNRLFLFTLSIAFLGFLTNCSNEFSDPASIPEMKEKSANKAAPGVPQLLASGLQGGSGSTIGPGGALYVTESATGRISCIDPDTGERTTYASGFPPFLIGIGGAMDIAFIGGTAYVLVTLVDDPNLFPTGEINGIYRVDGPNSFTVIADIGAFNLANPPSGFNYLIGTGVLYSMQTYRSGFLVSDGHLNRILQVSTKGEVSMFKQFGNIVPTGLEVSGNTIYMAEAGPAPHLPGSGKVVAFSANSPTVTTVASGARLLVDVEFDRGRTLFALAQGKWEGVPGQDDGSPAIPNDGSLVKVNQDGTFTTIAEGLDRPTSLEFIRNTAYIVTLTGEIWTVENAAGPSYGK